MSVVWGKHGDSVRLFTKTKLREAPDHLLENTHAGARTYFAASNQILCLSKPSRSSSTVSILHRFIVFVNLAASPHTPAPPWLNGDNNESNCLWRIGR